jgi:hypothetical protein
MPGRPCTAVPLLALAATGLLGASARADIHPVSAKEDVACLPASAARLHADTTLFPRPTRWRDGIPWLLDLEEGIRRARAEKRPLVLWVSGDDPLERC